MEPLRRGRRHLPAGRLPPPVGGVQNGDEGNIGCARGWNIIQERPVTGSSLTTPTFRPIVQSDSNEEVRMTCVGTALRRCSREVLPDPLQEAAKGTGTGDPPGRVLGSGISKELGAAELLESRPVDEKEAVLALHVPHAPPRFFPVLWPEALPRKKRGDDPLFRIFRPSVSWQIPHPAVSSPAAGRLPDALPGPRCARTGQGRFLSCRPRTCPPGAVSR